MSLSGIMNETAKFMSRNSATILTGAGIAGFGTTVVMAVKATPKAVEIIEDLEDAKDGVVTRKEIVKHTWKTYMPTALMGLLSVGCIIGATGINIRKHTALVGMYTLANRTLDEYQHKVIETIGEKKNVAIKEAVHKEELERKPVSENEVLLIGKGEVLCFDILSGRYFMGDIEKIKSTLNQLSRDLMQDMEISLNQVYYALGLEGIAMGEYMGWSIDDGLIEPDFSSHLTDEGKPCLVLDYERHPKYTY